MGILLIILGCILVLSIIFTLILFIGRAGLSLAYTADKKIIIKIKMLGLGYRLKPSLIKKETKKAKENVAEVEGDETETKLDLDIIKRAVRLIAFTRYKFTIKKVKIKIDLGMDDAAKTAILCGSLYSVIYTALGGLQHMYYVEKPQVSVNPMYNTIGFSHEYYFEISGRIKDIIRIAIKAYKEFNNKGE